MSRGVLIFAHNSDHTDYLKLAVSCAKRVHRFLNIPVSLITDRDTVPSSDLLANSFDNIIFCDKPQYGTRGGKSWLNRGRHQAYGLTPYKETILLDSDYMINSTRLLELFNRRADIICPRHARFLFRNDKPEMVGSNGPESMWATVLKFTKSSLAEDVFGLMGMIQDNWSHYVKLYNLDGSIYRNDWALTIALRTALGQVEGKQYHTDWTLLHVPTTALVTRVNDTDYSIENLVDGKKARIMINGLDFHMLNKGNYMELTC